MKFSKINILVAALVLSASGVANAIPNNSSGEMFLIAFDSTTNNSFIKALNVTASSFDGSAASNLTASLSADTNWTNFKGASTLATTSYSVLGLVKTASDLTSIVRSTASALGSVNNSNLASLYGDASNAGTLNLWLTNYNVDVLAGSSKYVAASTSGASANTLGNTWAGQLESINTSTSYGTSVDFYSLSQSGDGSGRGWSSLPATASSSLGAWNLSGDTISYVSVQAVPEAGTSAMMLAGIGLMGLIARRRKN